MLKDRLKEGYDWKDLEHTAPDWFKDLKFGMFFHFSGYSVAAYANEGYPQSMYDKRQIQYYRHREKYGSEFGYKDFLEAFKAEKFDPEEWAVLLEKAGVKYAGIVTEHCDNFSLWDSELTENCAMKVGPHRDIIGESFEAFRRHGIKTLCSFHDIGNPGRKYDPKDEGTDRADRANDRYYGEIIDYDDPEQVKQGFIKKRDRVLEVIEKYKPDILYFDSFSDGMPELYRQQIVDALYNLSGNPTTVITYKGNLDTPNFPINTGVFDLECTRFQNQAPVYWQNDDRVEDNVTWCIVEDPKYKTPHRVIQMLIDDCSKNGNLLLNLGPNADGTWPGQAKKVLMEVGEWLKVNGEGIYSTRPFKVNEEGPGKEIYSFYGAIKMHKRLNRNLVHESTIGMLGERDIRFTEGKDGSVYAFLMDWPKSNIARIETFKTYGAAGEISAVELLGHEGKLEFRQSTEALYVNLPEERPCENCFTLKITLNKKDSSQARYLEYTPFFIP